MNQLEWGSDRRGIPLPIADAMESLLNSTFDHNGPKPAMPFATEADVQGLLTMLFITWLSGGNPPLFMDFRKVWEPWEIQALAQEAGGQVHRQGAVGQPRHRRRRQLRLGQPQLGGQARRSGRARS